jgi:HSP20 family protein
MTTTPTCTCEPAPARAETIAPRQRNPLVDVVETPDAIVIRADVPGVRPADLDITFEDGSLTLLGKVQPRQAKLNSLVAEEYPPAGDFRRTFFVDVPVEADVIRAELKNGELLVTLPKSEAAKTKKIVVQAR